MYQIFTKPFGVPNRHVQKILHIMRLTTLLILAGLMQVSAAAIAQRITIKEKSVPLEKIFKAIRQQSGYDFIFDRKLLSKADPVSINLKNAPLDEVLKSCFDGQPFTFEIEEKTVIIKERKVSLLEKVQRFFQSITVTGVVRDENGKALSGVTVSVKGTDQKTFTNNVGSFILPNVAEDATLVFSSIGRDKVEEKVKSRSKIEIILRAMTVNLDEVKIDNGYQIAKRGNLVGSTATVKASELYLNGINTIEQSLQGKLPGVVVTTASGLVGTKQRVRVRGTSTLSGTQEPIWVVDGIIQEDPLPFKAATLNTNGDITPDNFDYIRNFVGNSIRWLNPMDIEDITVLKDASATAIYGVRAANGVIVITTKKGQLGPPAVSYSTNFSITEKVNYDKLNLMDSKERVALSREIFTRGLTSSFVNSNIGYSGALSDYLYKKNITAAEFDARVSAMETANTDWFDILFRAPISTSHNLSISGGNGSTRYYSSFGYNNNKGTAIGNDGTGLTGSLSVNSQLSKKINVAAKLSASQNSINGFYIVDPYAYASTMNRAIAGTNADGSPSFYQNKSGYLYNVINERDNTGNTNKVQTANATVNVNYEVIPGLRIQSLFSYTANSTNGESYATDRTEYIAANFRYNEYNSVKPTDAAYKNSRLPVGGVFNETTNNSNTWNWRNSISYTRLFGTKHSFSAMFGEEANSVRYKGYAATTYGYMRDRGRTFASIPLTYTSANTVNPLLVVMPVITDRLTNNMGLYLTSSYSYDNRYVVNVSVRNDRSNRFGQFTNEKFNPVWAGGLKWNMANEKWFEKSYWLSNLSFSGTFGYQRNIGSDVSPDLIIRYPTGSASSATDPFTGESLLTISSLPYGDLRWEENSSLNLGADFSLFNNKIQGSFQYYNKRGRELLTTLQVPLEYGVSSMVVNGGAINNTGYEASASFVPVRTRNFTWSVGMNTSKNNNTITKVGPQLISWQAATSGVLNKEGMPVSGFYAFRFTGINPDTGYPVIDRTVTPGADPKDPTSFMTYVGKLDPDFTSGISMNFRYKMLTLNSGFYLQLGGKKFLSPLYVLTNNLPTEYQNLSRQLLDRWTPTNKGAATPGLPDSSVPTVLLPSSSVATNVYEMYNYSTDRVVSASTFRCNNINLTYTLSENLVKRLKCKNINIGGGVSNPFAINSKDFRGLDAEVATGAQPRTRTYTINLNLSL